MSYGDYEDCYKVVSRGGVAEGSWKYISGGLHR
jgi:hypothetical protein